MTENNEHLALWGGRFTSGPSPELARLSKSTQFDWRLADDDIAGSRAHARALGRAGLLTADELQRMEDALDTLQRHVDDGSFAPIEDDEDEATALERGLIDIAGDELGGKLRAGRSRNDQIACLIRMWLRRHSRVIAGLLLDLVNALIEQSEKAGRTVMPGRTHMQHAQPVLLAHHFMAYYWMFTRDFNRLRQAFDAADMNPLGSAALAGTTYPLDRDATTRALGFAATIPNSLDAVSDRDFLLDLDYAASVSMIHLSRLAEEIILWSTSEFGFITLSDAFSTGSSIMPQKKNPDFAELIRGKSGRVVGDLVALMMTLKSLPLAYNKDLQEDKEGVIDAAKTLYDCLTCMEGMIATMKINQDAMRIQAEKGYLAATDVADYLAKKGMPFRQAHEVVGHLVLLCDKRGCNLDDLSLEDFKAESELFEEDITGALDLESIVAARTTFGGTSREALHDQMQLAEDSYTQDNDYFFQKQPA